MIPTLPRPTWYSMRPAPIVRCPTSEFPMLPWNTQLGVSTTAGCDSTRLVYIGQADIEAVGPDDGVLPIDLRQRRHDRRVRRRDRVAPRLGRDPPPIDADQDGRANAHRRFRRRPSSVRHCPVPPLH